MALATAAVALSACGAEDDELPTGPPGRPLFGFNDNGVRAGQLSPSADARLTAAVGGKVSRLTFDWRYAERTPDAYDFHEYDAIYRALRRRGVRPLWIVMFAPAWAWERGVQCAGEAPCRFPPARHAERHWREIVALIARRYPESAGIELWNEPNLAAFWRPRPDAARYLRLLEQGYRAVKRVRPRMPVVLGGLNNVQVSDGENVSLEDFLRAIYEGGGKRFMDALSVHPYPAVRTDPVFIDSMLQVIGLQEEFGDRDRPIWVTEIGATTSGADPDLRWSERGQAEALVDLYDTLARVPGVEMVLVHTLLETPGTGDDLGPGYGIVRPDGAPKPAYCALARRLGAAGIRC